MTADQRHHAQRLQGERHVHHRRRVTLGRSQIDHPPARDQIQTPSAIKQILLDERAYLCDTARSHLGELNEINLDVEVASVREQRAVLHQLEVLTSQHPS